MHCMAWHIIFFLKSLRSLEEFRKNPHVKIPPKSPSTNFQSLTTIKNQILFEKEFFLHFRPNRPSDQPAHPASQPGQPHCPPPFSRRPHACARPILACVALAYLPKAVSSSSLRSPVTMPSSSPPRRPTPVGISPRRRSLDAAAPRLGCPRAFTTLPHHSPPLIPFKPSVNRP
jgi:hypothetical protein